MVISGASLTANPVNYVLQDVQGSTRAVMSGTSVVARHDFLPFGEEIAVGVGMRTSTQGFKAVNNLGLVPDKIRQRYAMTERDDTTGRDHTWWRKYEGRSGRWTSPDPYLGNMTIGDPQSFNRFAYVRNDPVNLVDPTGLDEDQPPPYCPEGTVPMRDAEGKWQCVGTGNTEVDVPIPWDDMSDILPNWLDQELLSLRIELMPAPLIDSIPIIDPDPEQQPDNNTGLAQNREGLGTDAFDHYAKAGRPDLALACRWFGYGDWSNRMRKCLLENFAAPKNGRGGYVEVNPGWYPRWFGPVFGPTAHAYCLGKTT